MSKDDGSEDEKSAGTTYEFGKDFIFELRRYEKELAVVYNVDLEMSK